MPKDLCVFCKGKHILDGKHVLSRMHRYNIKKLPKDWHTASTEEEDKEDEKKNNNNKA